MSKPIIKKVALMASHDWTLRVAMAEFLNFTNPTIHWKGKDYQLELTRVIAKPVLAGTDTSKEADLFVDRTTHYNKYYRYWAHQAMNSLGRMVNHPYTFFVFDKHSTYDLMARAIHPEDRFPKTVLLPQFHPWREDQIKQKWWEYEQELIIENTELGFDESLRKTDHQTVQKKLEDAQRFDRRADIVRQHFYYSGDYLREVVEEIFENRFPLYLKKAYGGGGAKVYKIESLEELCERYDKSGEDVFHLQEGVEPYDVFYRAMGIGPIVFPMIFQPLHPLHEHYNPEKVTMTPELYRRLESYVLFINSYHRWTYNSFECLLKDGRFHPIDFANACPDSQFISLHTHFPLLVCSLLKWMAFCTVSNKDLHADLEMRRYLTVLNNTDIDGEEKFEFCRKLSVEFFEVEKFQEFCDANFTDLEDQMIEFYDQKFDEIIRFAMEFSDFPEVEHDHFYEYYKEMMDTHWRPNAKDYLKPVLLGED